MDTPSPYLLKLSKASKERLWLVREALHEPRGIALSKYSGHQRSSDTRYQYIETLVYQYILLAYLFTVHKRKVCFLHTLPRPILQQLKSGSIVLRSMNSNIVPFLLHCVEKRYTLQVLHT